MISIRSDDDSAEIDRGIRRLWLERGLHEREAEARRERKLVRFQPDESKQAAQHVVYLLRRTLIERGRSTSLIRISCLIWTRRKKQTRALYSYISSCLRPLLAGHYKSCALR